MTNPTHYKTTPAGEVFRRAGVLADEEALRRLEAQIPPAGSPNDPWVTLPSHEARSILKELTYWRLRAGVIFVPVEEGSDP